MNAPLRRGACPGLSAPMQTGDGLLVRLMPIGTIALAAFGTLCAAAREFGNGIVEITARGSIQVRGLSRASTPRFAAAVGALGIAADDGVAVHTNPLAGLDPSEILDAKTFAARMRRALARAGLAPRLAPKVSVVIDGGGAVSLDGLSADVRLRAVSANDTALFRISVGGDDAGATDIGFVAPEHGVMAAIALLEVVARRSRDARAKDIIASEGSASFKVAVADFLRSSNKSSCPASCRPSTSFVDLKDVDGRDKPGHDGMGNRRETIGKHLLRDGSFAVGVSLAFGHADASALEEMSQAAADAGARGMRAAPERALIAVGLSDASARAYAAAAERLGFIVRADDPRRFVVACAGAPICASAHIAARALAPRVAAEQAQWLGRSRTIHLSGCVKGCAHPAPASLTVVGRPDGCALIANGGARDVPFAIVAKDEVTAAIAKYVGEWTGEGGHG